MSEQDIKIELEKLKLEKLKLEAEDNKVRKFKWKNSRFKSLAKDSMKKPDYILVMYLSLKYEAKFMLCRIVSGNIIVIENKAHILDSQSTWRSGKDLLYIIREIDRMPVSNKDWNSIKERKDDTEADVPIIKAILGAVQKKEISETTRKWIIWILIGAAVIAGILFLQGK